MATRLEISFPTIRTPEFRVYIDDSEWSDPAIEVEAAADGFTLDYNGDTDPLDAIKGSRLTFTIAVSNDTLTEIESFAADLITAPEERFTMRVDSNTGVPLADDLLFWCGYVLPDLSGFEDKVPPYGFRVTATDGLARLKGLDYHDEADPPMPVEPLSFLEHILAILNRGVLSTLYFNDTDHFLKTSVNWSDGTIAGPQTTVCPLAFTRVNGEIFSKEITTNGASEFEFQSCYDVLKKLLEGWQCRIFFASGAYLVQQVAEISQDSFYERRFSKDGTLRSSSASRSYNTNVAQTGLDVRLSGGSFNYIPALRRVTAEWNHNSYKNYLQNAAGKWMTGSASSDSVVITDVTTDADTYFLIAGSVYFNVDLSDTYSIPWRYVIGLRVQKGSYYLTSTSYSVQNAQGDYLQQVGYDPNPPEWIASAGFVDISTDFITSETHQKEYPFHIITPVPPTGLSDITVLFNPQNGIDLEDNAMLSPALIEWHVTNAQFYIFKTNDPDTLFEIERSFEAENDEVGNSDTVEFKMHFGSHTQPWTPSKLQTSDDGATWTDSTDDWYRDAEAGVGDFGELWVQQAIALRKTPVQTYSGTFYSDDLIPHSRIIMPDSSAWIFARLTFSARELLWQGEWIAAGINESGISMIPTKKKGVTKPGMPGISERQQFPGVGASTSAALGTKKGDLAMMAITTNFVDGGISAGTITSIPVRIPVGGGTYIDGDEILVINHTTGDIFFFTISTTSLESDTALAVDSIAIAKDIPDGSTIVYSLLNKHLAGGSGLPKATNGYILVGNGAKWIATGGTNDGYPLVWDTTSGWQEEQLNTGGIANGAVTNAKAADMPANSLKGNPTNASLDPADLQVADITTDATPTTGDFLVGYKAAGTLRKFDVSTLPFSSGLPSGTDTQTIRYNGTTAEANSVLRNNGSVLGVGMAPTAGKMVSVKQTGAEDGIAVVKSDSATRFLELFYDTHATIRSGGGFNLALITAANAKITLEPGGGGGQIQQVAIAPIGNVTAVFGNTSILGFSAGYAPTTSGGDFSIVAVDATINQTGTADQVTRGIKVDAVFTAITAGFRGVEYIPSTQSFLWQASGNAVASHLIGNLGIGTGTTSPGAKIDIVGNGATSGTYALLISNSTPANIVTVRNDRRVGLLTTSPAVTLDAASATDAVALPTGTTAQRPAVNSSARVNSTVGGLEIRNAGAWNRLTCTVTPTIAAGAAAGTGPTVSIDSGNDLCHQVSVTTGTSTTTGILCTVTFNQPLDAGLFTFVVFSARNGNAAAEIAKFYIGATGNTSYTIDCAAAPTASTQYVFHVIAKQ